MDTSYKDGEVIINLKLLKLTRYYSLIDPNGKKIFGYNIHRIFFGSIFAINYALVVYANLGFFVNVDYKLSNTDFFIILFSDLQSFLTLFKMCLLFYRVDKLVDLLSVTRLDFLKSGLCCRNNSILYGHRNTFKKYTDFNSIFCVFIASQWILFGLLNMVLFFPDENVKRRIPNVINMPFPVNTHVYNQYFILFFAIESFFPAFLIYCSSMIDMYLWSYGWTITFQYEVLGLAFKDLGHENKRLIENENGHVDVNFDLKLILDDQLRLFLKFKSFYEVSNTIVLVNFALNSSGIIILTYTFIIVFSSPELFSVFYVVKIGTGDLYICLQLYLYFKLFESLNYYREFVNFGIYSCNWTKIDLKAKMLLLLTMHMNNANKLRLKGSPRRIVDLQQFSSVLTTCYNIVSVMMNTLSKKH